jgi:hypothetical protein
MHSGYPAQYQQQGLTTITTTGGTSEADLNNWWKQAQKSMQNTAATWSNSGIAGFFNSNKDPK